MMASAASRSAVEDAKLPSKTVIQNLLKTHDNKGKDLNVIQTAIGEATKSAIEKHNLNKDAFNAIKRLRKKSGAQIADFKAHFDLYWEHAGMDALMEDVLPMQDESDIAASKRNVGKMAAAEQGADPEEDGPRPSPFRATVEAGDKTIKDANGKDPKSKAKTTKPAKDRKPAEPASNIRRLTPRAPA